MSEPIFGVVGIITMLVGIFVLNMAPGPAMALFGFLGLVLLADAPLQALVPTMNTVASSFWEQFSKPDFAAIPLFILLGEVIYYAGYSAQLFDATHKWFGSRRGGLAITTVLASAGFSAICGSNTATAATMSAVAIPSMTEYNYHPVLKTGAVAAGSTLGVMVPPSIVLVVYGLYTGESIGKLFFGSVIPSMVLTSLIVLTVVGICRLHPTWGPAHAGTTLREKLAATPQVLDILILFAVIMYTLMSGKVTPTEVAGVACLLAVGLCLLRRKLSWLKFRNALRDTLRITCMVFVIMAGAKVFGMFLTLSYLPTQIARAVGELGLPGPVILSIILLCYIIGGCLMDALAFLLISLPIFLPLIKALNYDPIWFGVVVCVVTTLGAITPPIGISCYVIAGMCKSVRVEQVFQGALYYVPSYILTVLILLLCPHFTVGWLASFAR